MQAIIFDLDGVLVDSMPKHFEAWKVAFEKVTSIEISERDIYLLEGMRGIELVEKIFEQKRFPDRSLARRVHEEKSRIFKSLEPPEPFESVREMIAEMKCAKAVVSGSTRNDVESLVDSAFGIQSFDAIITADDVEKGKPDPSGFLEALRRINFDRKHAAVVENAPLGVKAANNAGIVSYVALNNTALAVSDFDGIISQDRIFDKTTSLRKELCK